MLGDGGEGCSTGFNVSTMFEEVRKRREKAAGQGADVSARLKLDGVYDFR